MKTKDKEKKKKYYSADQDKIQRKMDEIGSGDYFKAKEGKNVIRILPPWSKAGLWYKEVTIHYGLKNEEGKERAFPCLKMFDSDCPACDKRDELLQGGKEDKKMGEKLRGRTKFYTNIIDRKSDKAMIWGFSQKTLGTLLSYCGDPDYGDISSPEEGFDVIIERTGTTMTDTRYAIRCRPKPSEVGVEGWEDKIKDLDEEVVDDMTEEELQEIVDLNFGDTDSDDDEEEKPKKKKAKEDEDEDEEDEEEEKPKKKKKSSDEDDEEDEDEEEEKPKKKKKSSDDDDEEEDRPKKKKKSKDDEEDEDEEEDDDEDE